MCKQDVRVFLDQETGTTIIVRKALQGIVRRMQLEGYAPDTNMVMHDMDEEQKIHMLSKILHRETVVDDLVRFHHFQELR